MSPVPVVGELASEECHFVDIAHARSEGMSVAMCGGE